MRKPIALITLLTVPAMLVAHPGEHTQMGVLDGILHHFGHPLSLALLAMLIGATLLSARRRRRHGVSDSIHSRQRKDPS